MITGIIIGIIIAICIISLRSYLKKLAYGCCGAGGDNEKTKNSKSDLSGYKYRYTVKISGMSCKKCAAKIENTFNRQGMYAQADFKNGTAEIYSKSPIAEYIVRQTIVGLGYSVERTDENEL